MSNPNPPNQFKKGRSANPGGRPKAPWTFLGLYKEELDKLIPTVDGKQMLAKTAVVKRLTKMAIEGDLGAIKELHDRVEGRPIQKTEIEGELTLGIIKIPMEDDE